MSELVVARLLVSPPLRSLTCPIHGDSPQINTTVDGDCGNEGSAGVPADPRKFNLRPRQLLDQSPAACIPYV